MLCLHVTLTIVLKKLSPLGWEELNYDFNISLELLKLLFNILLQKGPPWFVFSIVLIILVWFLFCPEKAEKCASLLYRMFASISYFASRKYISLNIQGEINGKIKKLNKEVKDALPYRMKIRWVKAEEAEAEVKNGNVIVFMRDYKNQSINIAHAALAYTCKGLLPKARNYVEPTLMRSIDYMVAMKIAEGNTGAVKYLNELFESESSKNTALKSWRNKLISIDKQGYLTRVMIFDFKSLSEFFPGPSTDDIRKETAEYAKLVHRLATKKPGEKVNPSFNGKYLHVAITPIARAEIMTIDPHLNFIKHSLNEGVNTFHIVAVGKRNITLARIVMKRAEKELGLIRIKDGETYKGFYRGMKTDMFHAILERPSKRVVKHLA